MNQDALVAPTSLSHTTEDNRPLLLAAWGIVLAITLPEILLRGFMQLDIAWITPARIGLLAVLLALTLVWRPLHPLRGFTGILLVIYGVEGWFFLTALPQTGAYQALFGGDTHLAFLGERLLRIGATIVMLLVLLVSGLKRRDFFLAVGDLKARAEPDRFIRIPPRPEPWSIFGRNYALISVGLLLAFMVPAMQPTLSTLSAGLVLFAALCAGLNAFAEEFLYRSALLPQVLSVFPPSSAILLVAGWFGLGHFFGVPAGITGVLITAVGGWFFAKSMVETRGMGWAWFLHFLADFTVYLIVFLAAGG